MLLDVTVKLDTCVCCLSFLAAGLSLVKMMVGNVYKNISVSMGWDVIKR